MRLIPSWKQWQTWSLPSKASYLGLVLAVVSLMITMLALWTKPSPDRAETSSFNVEGQIEEIKDLIAAQRVRVAVVGDHGITVTHADFLQRLEDMGFSVQVTRLDPRGFPSGRSMAFPPNLQEAAESISRLLPPPVATNINPQLDRIVVAFGPDRQSTIIVVYNRGDSRLDLVTSRLQELEIQTLAAERADCDKPTLTVLPRDEDWGQHVQAEIKSLLPQLKLIGSDDPILGEFRGVLCLNGS